MITRVSVRNFQSLHVLDLDLAPLTVIVGPSSSGKSAFVRALRTLASNARGTGYISTWAKRTVISVDLADTIDPESHRGTLTLTRSKKSDENEYTIEPPPAPHEGAPPSRFTKLGGAVPPEVTQFLGIEPSDPLRLASQFDHPFLLDDAPAEVARTLAALTNVDTVFSAAREANRTRLNTGTVLKHRQADHASAQERLERFKPLAGWIPALQSAEQHLQSAFVLESRIKNLSSALSRLQAAEQVIARTAPLLQPVPTLAPVEHLTSRITALRAVGRRLEAAEARVHALPTVPVPSLEAVEAAHQAHSRFHDTLLRLKAASARQTAAADVVRRTTEEKAEAEHAYLAALREAGACPTCGQNTEHIHLEAIHA